MFTVYILYSRKFAKTYTGFTSNFEERLKSHNELGKKDWTRSYRPWEVAFTELYESKKDAMQREKFLKSGVGRFFVKERISDFLKTGTIVQPD